MPPPIPWWLDLDLFDYATKELKIPVGPYRIRLDKDNQPLGGVELAPGGKLPRNAGIFERGRGLPPIVPEEFIIQQFRKIVGRNPSDDEITQLAVVTGHQPGKRPFMLGQEKQITSALLRQPEDA